MKLPTVKGSKIGLNQRSIHEGRHLPKVNEHLAEKMTDKLNLGIELNWTQHEFATALKNIIIEEKLLLKSGERMLNKHARPHAKPLS